MARTLGLALVLLPLTAIPASLSVEDGDRLATQRSAFLKAERALKRKDQEGFHRLLGGLQDYPLYPYLAYKDLRQRLNDADAEEIEAFLDTYADTPLAPRLRRSWVKSLHRQKRWEGVVRAYQPTSSTDSRCRYLQALYQTGERDAALVAVEDLWLVSYSQPPACDPILDAWRKADRLTPELTWARVRLAMNAGRPGLAQYLARFLPTDDRPLVDLWRKVRRSPSTVRDDSQFSGDHEIIPEIVVYGVRRWAHRTPEDAARAWGDIKDRFAFTEAQVASVQRSIGLTMARRNQPEALDWLSAIEEPWTDRRVRESRALTALRNGGWDQALAWMDELAPDNRATERWQYWRARSLDQLGQKSAAMDIFSKLAGQRDFYGFLAADRASLPYALNSEPLGIAESEVEALSWLPGIRRAHELYLLGRTVDARREWHHTITAMAPGSLPAAAVLAHRWGWHDRAILTLGRTEHLDDLDMRFPLAFREPVMKQAKRQEIDPAWIFAVMRQESAFSADARSPAGAMGLMQLMPRTARQVARKLNTRLPSRVQLLHADTNIRLGSAYLRRLLDDLDEHAALATAAYNAGPHRVRSWLPKDSEMPADLWIESVPFSETHNYVRRVFAYTAIYEQRLGQQPKRLTQRLRPVPSKPSQASTAKRG